MASVSSNTEGKRRIMFAGPQGRKTVYLGKVNRKMAESAKLRIETILTANEQGQPLDFETATWLAERPDTFYQKLVAVGLVPPRESTPLEKRQTLGPFLEQYIDGRTDIKPGTRTNLNQAKTKLLQYFGADKYLSAITHGDADEFRLDLLRRLDDNTARRHCGRAKQFFRAAVRKKIIRENPFGDMKQCNVKGNPSKFYFIGREVAQKVLDACPDTQWRLLFALSRFGGLRCPSEHLALRWGDVDWERGRILVHSPKTEGHEGGESRQIPIFPELRPYLEEAWEQAEFPAGDVPVITRYRDASANLRTQLQRIIRRAGLTAWPKLWQNLRSTRETELAETYPLHVVCAWIGNSQKVAQKHYLQVRDSDFEKASALLKSNAEYDAEVTHFATQPSSADSRQSSQETQKALENQGFFVESAKAGKPWQNTLVTPTGAELSASSAGNQGVALNSNAFHDAFHGDSLPGDVLQAPIDRDLAEVVRAWPSLPHETRRRVLELVSGRKAT